MNNNLDDLKKESYNLGYEEGLNEGLKKANYYAQEQIKYMEFYAKTLEEFNDIYRKYNDLLAKVNGTSREELENDEEEGEE